MLDFLTIWLFLLVVLAAILCLITVGGIIYAASHVVGAVFIVIVATGLLALMMVAMSS